MWNPISTGLLLMRLSLGGMLLWFGVSEILAPQDWAQIVPLWVSAWSNLSAPTVVLILGILETMGAIFLILGVFVRTIALLLALNLLVSVATTSFAASSVQELCFAGVLFGLALAGGGSFSLPIRALKRHA